MSDALDRLRARRSTALAAGTGAASSSLRSGTFSSFTSPLRGGMMQRPVLVGPTEGRGRVFVRINSAQAVCRGVVKGNRVCVRALGQCSYDSHLTTKAHLQEDAIYFRAAKTGALSTVGEDVWIPTVGMEEELVEFLLDLESEHDLPTGTGRSFQNFLVNHGVKTLEDYHAAVDSDREGKLRLPKTPFAKRRMDDLGVSDLFSATEGTSARDSDVGLEDLVAVKRLKSLTEKAMTLGMMKSPSGSDPASSMRMEPEAREGAGGSWGKGDDGRSSRDNFFISLASRIDTLAQFTGEVAKDLSRFSEASFVRTDAIDNMMLSHKNIMAEIQEAIGPTPDLSDLGGPDLDHLNLESHIWGSIASLAGRMGDHPTKEEMDATLNMILADIDDRFQHVKDASDAFGMTDASSPQDSPLAKLGAVEEKLRSLESTLIRNRPGNSSVVFELGGLPFSTDLKSITARLEELLGNNNLVLHMSCFPSPTLFMERMYQELYEEKDVSFDLYAKTVKVDLEIDDHRMLETFNKDTPLLFTTKTKIPNAKYSGGSRTSVTFPAIPTAEDFGHSSVEDSCYYLIQASIDNAEAFFESKINSKFAKYPELIRFCRLMLQRSKKFVDELFRYMESSHKELAKAFGDSNEAWEMVCVCVTKIFRVDFRTAKRDVAGLTAADSLNLEGGLQFIRASVGILEKAEEFISLGIKNHPSLSSSMIRFILSQSEKGKVKTIGDEVKLLKEKLGKADVALKDVKKSNKDLEDKYRSLQAKVDRMERSGSS